MCILFLHVDPNPDEEQFRLILATNRDEYYKRPAKDAFQSAEPAIIGGRDMEPGREGGMWLGFSTKNSENGKGKKHCVSALLNITGEKIEKADGRGIIVTDYLESSLIYPDYIKTLQAKKLHFNGYNAIAVELSKDGAFTFHHGNMPQIDSVYTGKHTLGFGNSPTYCPLTKVVRGRNRFEDIIKNEKNKDVLVEELLKLLKDETSQLPDDELQKRSPIAYKSLSSIFVKLEDLGYGTRTHTIILIDYNWNLEYIEHTLNQPIDIKNPKWNVNVIKSRL